MAPTSQQLAELLTSEAAQFLTPSLSLHKNWIAATKQYLDPLAQDISRTQRQRKRKRSEAGFSDSLLQLQEVHAEGFTERQVWEQANRVLKSCFEETERDVSVLAEIFGEESGSKDDGEGEVEDGVDPEDSGDDLSRDLDSAQEVELEENDEDSEGSISGEDDVSNLPDEGEGDVENEEDITMEEGYLLKDDSAPSTSKSKTVRQDKHGLNDGFFSLDDFNAQSDLFERKDAKGGGIDEESDEDGAVNWDADPLAGLGGEEGDSEEEDEDMDLDDQPVDDLGSDAEDGDAGGDIMYDDFFDPPVSTDTGKKLKAPKPQKELQNAEEDIDGDIERSIRDVRRDLFDDEESDVDEEEATTGNRTSSKKAAQSSHESRRAKITNEIQRLEAMNVAKRDWTLSGEAQAVDRPMNSLIEEDLDFERTGKPVPVISNEVSEEIEELVKRRIINKEFDELIRRSRIPSGQGVQRSEKFVLDDTKPQQSLAEQYETEHLQATDPNYVSQKSAKLQKDHAEVTQLWNSICSQLDALSSWHYRPKQPQASVNVVKDVATVSMEDQRPTAGGNVDVVGTLAPHEIYAPGDDGTSRGEIVGKNGAPIARDEMSREAKLRRRKREKQKLKKQGVAAGGSSKQVGNAAAEQQQVAADLKRGGVKIIGKGGDLKDMSGNKAQAQGNNKSQGFIKL